MSLRRIHCEMTTHLAFTTNEIVAGTDAIVHCPERDTEREQRHMHCIGMLQPAMQSHRKIFIAVLLCISASSSQISLEG